MSFQFSLKALLGLQVAAGVLFYLASSVHSFTEALHREEVARQIVESAGGECHRGDDLDPFDRVTDVLLTNTGLEGEGLSLLRDFPQLFTVEIGRPQLHASLFKNIRNIYSLTVHGVSLNDTDITLLIESDAYERLRLENCTLSESQLELLQSKPGIILDVINE